VTAGAAGTRDRSAPSGWHEYLDALEAAVRAVDEALVDGREPAADAVAALDALVAPTSPPPARLMDRRTLLLALLHDVAVRAQSRRDVIAAELAALPRRRSVAPDTAATLGGTLDIVG
jgi:hypothetical protein